MEINQSFIDNYLQTSSSVDNYLFENCDKNILQEVGRILKTCPSSKRQCVVHVTKDEETQVLKLLDQCSNSYERAILARDFANAKVMREIYRGVDNNKFEMCDKCLKSFYNVDLWNAKINHKESVIFPYDIISFVKEKEKIDLNIVFEDISSFEIQRAFNNYMSARLPLSVKFFLTGKLSSSADQALNLIQSPHDFISVNINNFIYEDSSEK